VDASTTNSQRTHESYAYYVLTGTRLDPPRITATTGVTPSRTWKAGDVRNPRTGTRHELDGWRVDSPLPQSSSPEEHVEALVGHLARGWAALCELGARHDALVMCVVYMYDAEGPVFGLSPTVVQRLAELNAGFDADLYCLLGAGEGDE
jgi:hypothetical protein